MDGSEWTIHLLGSFRIARNGVVVERLGLRKEELLLAWLALAPQTAHYRGDLASAFFPSKGVAAARRNLSCLLFMIRDRLDKLGVPDCILVGAQSLHLDPRFTTDVQTFSGLVLAATHASTDQERTALCGRALAMYGGGLLPGVDLPWVQAHRRQLDALYELALRQLADVLQPAGPSYQTLRSLPASVWAGHHQVVSDEVGRRLTPVDRPSGDDPATELRSWWAFVKEGEPRFRGPDRLAWIERIDVEYPAIKAALDRAIGTKNHMIGLQIAATLWRYWYHRGKISEGRWYLERLLPAAQASPSIPYARGLHAAGTLAHKAGDAEMARLRLTEALDVWKQLDDDEGLVQTLANLGMVACRSGDYAHAQGLYRDCVAVARRLGNPGTLAIRLSNAATVELRLHNPARARELLGEQLAIAERLGDRGVVASALVNLASADLMADDLGAAQEHADAAVRIFESLQDPRGEAQALRALGCIAQQGGDCQRALVLFQRSAVAANVSGDPWEAGQTLRYLAAAYEESGRPARAATVARQAVELLESTGDDGEAEKARAMFEHVQSRRAARPKPAKPSRGGDAPSTRQ